MHDFHNSASSAIVMFHVFLVLIIYIVVPLTFLPLAPGTHRDLKLLCCCCSCDTSSDFSVLRSPVQSQVIDGCIFPFFFPFFFHLLFLVTLPRDTLNTRN